MPTHHVLCHRFACRAVLNFKNQIETARKLTERLKKASMESKFSKEDVLEALRGVSQGFPTEGGKANNASSSSFDSLYLFSFLSRRN